MREVYEQLEVEFAEWQGLDPRCMVACNSGTAALHLAFEAMSFQWGNIIVPEFTMVACARAVAMSGHRPIFVDCDDRLQMDGKQILPMLDENTRAILAVHVYGRSPRFLDPDPDKDPEGTTPTPTQPKRHTLVYHLANSFTPLVEDLAEVHSVKPMYLSAAACWSFYRNKVIAGEEGGAVWFKDRAHAVRARMLRSHGFTPEHDFQHIPRGHNYRLSNVHAELILKSLRQVDENLKRRREVESWYDEFIPDEYRMGPRRVPWVYDLRLPDGGHNQAALVRALNCDGIAARMPFRPMSMQAEFLAGHTHLRAYRECRRVIYLPITPTTQRSEVQKACEYLKHLY